MFLTPQPPRFRPPEREAPRKPEGRRRDEAFEDILDDAAEALRQTGQYQRNFTEHQLDPIMRGIVESLISRQTKVRGRLLGASMDIFNDQGILDGAVEIESPVNAKIILSCRMVNDRSNPNMNMIRGVSIGIKEEAGILARAGLKAFGARNKIQEKLRDPNKAFGDELAEQLAPRGVKLTEVRLRFDSDRLVVGLSGEQLQRK